MQMTVFVAEHGLLWGGGVRRGVVWWAVEVTFTSSGVNKAFDGLLFRTLLGDNR